jgi:hypothetical protein
MVKGSTEDIDGMRFGGTDSEGTAGGEEDAGWEIDGGG